MGRRELISEGNSHSFSQLMVSPHTVRIMEEDIDSEDNRRKILIMLHCFSDCAIGSKMSFPSFTLGN